MVTLTDLKNLGKVLLPSALEIVIMITAFVVLLLSYYLSKQGVIGLTTLGKSSFSWPVVKGVADWITHITQSRSFNEIDNYLFWGLIGLISYEFVRFGMMETVEVASDIKSIRYVGPSGVSKSGAIISFAESSILRLGVIIALFIYMVKLIPSINSLWKHRIHEASNFHTLLLVSGSILLTALFLHGIIVALRLILLRQRIV